MLLTAVAFATKEIDPAIAACEGVSIACFGLETFRFELSPRAPASVNSCLTVTMAQTEGLLEAVGPPVSTSSTLGQY